MTAASFSSKVQEISVGAMGCGTPFLFQAYFEGLPCLSTNSVGPLVALHMPTEFFFCHIWSSLHDPLLFYQFLLENTSAWESGFKLRLWFCPQLPGWARERPLLFLGFHFLNCLMSRMVQAFHYIERYIEKDSEAIFRPPRKEHSASSVRLWHRGDWWQ